MAITIDRTGITLTNDTGTPASPNSDGTLLNAADRAAVLDRIDELFNGTRAATFSFGTLLSVDGFGVSTFSAGGTGGNVLAVRNTTSGTGNYSELRGGNNATASLARIKALSSAFTSAGYDFASGVTVEGTGSGGLNLAASDASGPFRVYTGGTTQRLAIDSVGTWTFLNSSVTAVPLAAGSVSAPSLGFASETNLGLYRGAAGRINVAAGGQEVAAFEYGSLDGKRLVMKHHSDLSAAPPAIEIQRNTGGAGGALGLQSRDGTAYWLYVSNDGKLRIYANSFPPRTIDSDTVGTIVGTQS